MTSPASATTSVASEKPSHPFNMYKHIHAQPEAIKRVFKEEKESAKKLSNFLASKDNSKLRIHFVGIGTSYHAALIGEYLFSTVAGCRGGDKSPTVRAWQSFEFAIGDAAPELSDNDVVIVMSHRGWKHYSAKARQVAKEKGATVVLMTSLTTEDVGSVDFVLRTSVPETSSAFTESHTSAISVQLLVAITYGVLRQSPLALQLSQSNIEELLPKAVQDTISLIEPAVSALAHSFVQDFQGQKNKYKQFFIGSGVQQSNAYEVALKIKETSYLRCEGLQLEQFLHGPFCGVDDTALVVFLVPTDANSHPYQRTLQIMAATVETGAKVVAITTNPEFSSSSIASKLYHVFHVPTTHEALSAITYLTVLQLWTYWLSIEMETNPDIFRRDDIRHQQANTKNLL